MNKLTMNPERVRPSSCSIESVVQISSHWKSWPEHCYSYKSVQDPIVSLEAADDPGPASRGWTKGAMFGAKNSNGILVGWSVVDDVTTEIVNK